MDQNEAAIREVFSGFERAMRACEAAAVVAHYAPELVKFTLAPPLAQPAAEAVDPGELAAWFDSHGGGPMDYAITDLHVSVDGDVAFAHSLNRMGSPDGDGFSLWFRASYGLCRSDGTWLIVHEHESTPFYMDGSLRAAVDLAPDAVVMN
jgi:ketosteroid isomerase-like protein